MKNKKKLLATVLCAALATGVLTPNAAVRAEGELPSSFDLRSRGVVTSVKDQSPWSTCWAFGGSAAAESSILTQMGLTAEAFKKKYGKDLDLSEKHLTWWTYHVVPENDPDDPTQAGEGVHIFKEKPGDKVKRNAAYDMGGFPLYVTSIYSSGLGPVRESGKLVYGGYKNGKRSYDIDADWTLKDNTRDFFSFELKDGNLLPDPTIWADELDENGSIVYKGYDPSATEAIKQELYKGRGVSVAYEADISTPQELADGVYKQEYMSENWAQYIDGEIDVNHGVCIVGWDDNYPVSNFNAEHQPPGPGAWLVKNSWGSGNVGTRNHNYYDEWGIEDANGHHTGYFWLSYYDHTICMPESFAFVKVKKSVKEMIVGQYDYLQAGQEEGGIDFSGKRKRQMANVYQAPRNMRLGAVGTDTFEPNTTVRFDVYKVESGYTSPTQGKRIATKTATFPYEGYHRLELGGKHIIKKGEYYSVVVTQQAQTEDGKEYIVNASYGYGKNAAKKYGLDCYANAVVNRGESFYGYADKSGKIKWSDWVDKIKSEKKQYKVLRNIEFDNFAIKAYSYPVK